MLENLLTKIWRFLKRIGVKDKIGKWLSEPLISLLAEKEKMLLFPNENWGTRLRYLLRWYEPESTKACRKFLKPGMNILDIGADIGYYSRLFSELVGPKGKVWAFEPYPDSYNLLKKNTISPKYRNVIPVKKAISDSSGKVKFFAASNPGNPGKHGFYDVSKINPDFSLKNNLTVETITVDDFLLKEGNPQINFIKMDIEGAEPKALTGMKNTVIRSRNLAMIVEFNVKALQLAGENSSLFLNQLENMGFKIQTIQPNGNIKPVDGFSWRFAKEGYLNLFCLKVKEDKSSFSRAERRVEKNECSSTPPAL